MPGISQSWLHLSWVVGFVCCEDSHNTAYGSFCFVVVKRWSMCLIASQKRQYLSFDIRYVHLMQYFWVHGCDLQEVTRLLSDWNATHVCRLQSNASSYHDSVSYLTLNRLGYRILSSSGPHKLRNSWSLRGSSVAWCGCWGHNGVAVGATIGVAVEVKFRFATEGFRCETSFFITS